MTASNAIRDYRTSHRLTQVAFCELLKEAGIAINRTTLGSIENPEKIAKVTFGTVKAVCLFCGVTTIELRDVTDSEK